MSKVTKLFAGYGIELEYMIVDKDTLNVLPVTDEVIKKVAGEYVSDVSNGEIDWSNELALHVIELKTNGPAKSLDNLPQHFHENILRINKILEEHNGMLMPTAMHPWMDPFKEMKLWPHEYNAVYEAYNRIFDCRGHGWSNLQSVHINLPFADDSEFEKLHAAVRLVLPLIPALSAASPIREGKVMPELDHRLEVYRKNQAKVPLIAGHVIPERVFSKSDYDKEIFQPLYKAISEYDKEGIMQEEWLNSRGAIARFDRNTIEIRLIDIQECPTADLAISAFLVGIIKALVNEEISPLQVQKVPDEKEMHTIFLETLKDAGSAEITYKPLLDALGVNKEKDSAKNIFKQLLEKVSLPQENFRQTIEYILDKGTLAERILKRTGKDPDKDTLKSTYSDLCTCLMKNEMFKP